ncbi:MAG: ATP-binding protein [Aquificota bacterium]|nr:MAG: ATP-binding protein [Aquificota bacterium]
MAECDGRKVCSTCEKASVCDAEEQRRHQEELLRSRLSKIKHRIMVMSGKGGVGKSTVAANLAWALAQKGFRVGLLDADIHGPNVPLMLGVEGRRLAMSPEGIEPLEVGPGIKVVSMSFLLHDSDTPVIWRGPLKMGALRQFLSEVNWGDLDFLLVDLPPGTGDEPLSIAQLINKMDGSIIVTTPQDVALLDSRKSVNFSKRVSVPVLGIIENMSGLVCPHCGGVIELFKMGGGEKAARELGVPFLGRIPLDPRVVELGDEGKPLVEAAPDSLAAKAFQSIVEGVLEKVGESTVQSSRF